MFFLRWTVTSPVPLVEVLVRKSVSPPQEGQNFKSIFFVILPLASPPPYREWEMYVKHP
jgi:hypothetical protein